jgi:hypothetical protein
MPSHTGDGAAKATWPQEILMPSHADDDTDEVTWPRRDVHAESYAGDNATELC